MNDVFYIPEWEIEETIASDHSLLKLSDDDSDFYLIERQRFLPTVNRYVDLLFKWGENFLIVEVKNRKIENPSVIYGQLLQYREALAEEFNLEKPQIKCALATIGGFSDEIKNICFKEGIIVVNISKEEIVESSHQGSPQKILPFYGSLKNEYVNRILSKRKETLDSLMGDGSLRAAEINQGSVRKWTTCGTHDELAKYQIAQLFLWISKNAPIMAHEIKSGSCGYLKTNSEKWFWLFYSVLDRRSNASLFVKAREILEAENLFDPKKTSEHVKGKGEIFTINKLSKILEKGGFPLLRDYIWKEQAQPKSIVDAALFIERFSFDFDHLYQSVLENNIDNKDNAVDLLWNIIQKEIYGVGPRIASQFIRGMVLKSNWDLPLTRDYFLETAKFNITFAGDLRFALISSEDNFNRDLGIFADKYLDGDRGIISHVLWYIRKQYESEKIPSCDICPMAGFCKYYRKKIIGS